LSETSLSVWLERGQAASSVDSSGTLISGSTAAVVVVGSVLAATAASVDVAASASLLSFSPASAGFFSLGLSLALSPAFFLSLSCWLNSL